MEEAEATIKESRKSEVPPTPLRTLELRSRKVRYSDANATHRQKKAVTKKPATETPPAVSKDPVPPVVPEESIAASTDMAVSATEEPAEAKQEPVSELSPPPDPETSPSPDQEPLEPAVSKLPPPLPVVEKRGSGSKGNKIVTGLISTVSLAIAIVIAVLAAGVMLGRISLPGVSQRNVLLAAIGPFVLLSAIGVSTTVSALKSSKTGTIERLFIEHNRLLESISHEESKIVKARQSGKASKQLEESLATHRNLLATIAGQISQLETKIKPTDPILDSISKGW